LANLYTIGHSTRPLDELIEALHAHSILTLADIRSFPVSRRLPQFDRDSLEQTLPAAGMQYVWMKGLGTPLWVQFREWTDDTSEIEAMVATYREYNLTHHDTLAKPYDGVSAAVLALHERGVRLGIVTPSETPWLPQRSWLWPLHCCVSHVGIPGHYVSTPAGSRHWCSLHCVAPHWCFARATE